MLQSSSESFPDLSADPAYEAVREAFPALVDYLSKTPSPSNADILRQFDALRLSLLSPVSGPQAAGPVPAVGPTSPLPVLPQQAVVTAPGQYGAQGPDGSFKAYRDPGFAPPLRDLNT